MDKLRNNSQVLLTSQQNPMPISQTIRISLDIYGHPILSQSAQTPVTIRNLTDKSQ